MSAPRGPCTPHNRHPFRRQTDPHPPSDSAAPRGRRRAPDCRNRTGGEYRYWRNPPDVLRGYRETCVKEWQSRSRTERGVRQRLTRTPVARPGDWSQSRGHSQHFPGGGSKVRRGRSSRGMRSRRTSAPCAARFRTRRRRAGSPGHDRGPEPRGGSHAARPSPQLLAVSTRVHAFVLLPVWRGVTAIAEACPFCALAARGADRRSERRFSANRKQTPGPPTPRSCRPQTPAPDEEEGPRTSRRRRSRAYCSLGGGSLQGRPAQG